MQISAYVNQNGLHEEYTPMHDEKAALEEELGDITNVEDGDESDDEESIGSDLYSISSFGVDLDVEALVKRLKNETYYVPNFQRQYVWSQTAGQSRFRSLR
jgi:fructose/tagatose bisphosphate aldolase